MKNEDKVRIALGRVLTNVLNYPDDVQARLLGARLDKVIDAAVEAVLSTGAVECVDVLSQKPQVSRVELIINSQRDRVLYGVTEVSTALQDDGRTLKVFLLKED